MTTGRPPADVVEELLADTDQRLSDLGEYFDRFTGSYFDTSGRRSDQGWADPSPNQFTIEDVQSTALLSVALRPPTMIELLDANNDLTGNLAGLPDSVDLADAEDAAGPWTGIWEDAAAVYWRLRRVDGVGRTVASKLLARKRPALIPVWDTRVSGILGTADDDNDWAIMQEIHRAHRPALADLISRLSDARPGDDRVSALSELRVLDVVLWMSGEAPRSTPES